jgi:hypothetical protein
MSQIKRRHFLQLAGSTLATLGLSQFEIQQQSLRFAQSVAQSGARKLALIVGVNHYDDPIPQLYGCVNDAHLMRELLVHRFGFDPKDVLLVTDDTSIKPTRSGILQAFQEHLIAQAQPDDIVVFHFSGHGSQVSDRPDCDAVAAGLPDCVNSTFCPSDSFASGTTFTKGGVVNDITGHTLFLLMSAVKAKNMTVVLDSCHSGGGTRGNFLVRAVPRLEGGELFDPSPTERELQSRLRADLNLSQADYIRQRREGVAKGAVLASARREQYAADAPFDDFYAGAFTYTMSRYLWQQTQAEGMGNALLRIALSAKTQADLKGLDQDPEAEYYPGSSHEQDPFFFLSPDSPPAEAIITDVQGKRFTCWLGGVEPSTLDAFDSAEFAIVDRQGTEQGQVKLTSRNGLQAEGVLIKAASPDAFKVGAFLQEKVRGIAADVPLEIAVDESLGSDLLAVEQALAQVLRLKVLPQGQGGQYLFVRVTAADHQRWNKGQAEEIPAIGSLGLATPGLDAYVSGSFSAPGTPIATAVDRLLPKFKLLLAGRLLQLMHNSGSAQLAVDIEIKTVGTKSVLPVAVSGTSRGRTLRGVRSSRGGARSLNTVASQEIKSGSLVEITVQNNEPQPLYIAVIGIGSTGNMVVFFPSEWNVPGDATLVNTGETIHLGKEDFDIRIKGVGVAQVLVLASAMPLRNALKSLQRIASEQGIRRGLLPIGEEAENAVNDLLGGIDQNTRSADFTATPKGHRAISTNQLAVIAVALEVVA